MINSHPGDLSARSASVCSVPKHPPGTRLEAVLDRMDTVEKKRGKKKLEIRLRVWLSLIMKNQIHAAHHFQLHKELSIHSLPQDSEAVMKEHRLQERG